jgi:hypothetical protein
VVPEVPLRGLGIRERTCSNGGKPSKGKFGAWVSRAGPGISRLGNSSVSVPDSDPFGHGPGLLLPPLVRRGAAGEHQGLVTGVFHVSPDVGRLLRRPDQLTLLTVSGYCENPSSWPLKASHYIMD